jgi:pimeloyl-ACP methyl ester carboxylesterase
MISDGVSRRTFLGRSVLGGIAGPSLLSRINGRPAAVLNAQEPRPEHRFVMANGIRIHLAEQGRGRLVLLCHGFPESWYSWRHQLTALADAGFHAVAPDMRGYGQTDRPEAIDQYTLMHLIGDMVGVLDALRVDSAVIAGHDWGAIVAWHAVLLRPDRFRSVIALSGPFRPRGTVRPTTAMPQTDTALYYQLYFQKPGVAEAELERDTRDTMRRLFLGDGVPGGMVPRSGGWLTGRVARSSFPSWLTEADLEFYAGEFARTGFRGGLNWYRNLDRNWELLAPYAGMRIGVPALFVAGDRDPVLSFPGMDIALKNLSDTVPHLRKALILPGCGHRTQQERSRDVNAAMIEFLKAL